MSIISYPGVFHREDSGWWVEFPDLPGCFTQGDTIEECHQMAMQAMGMYLDQSSDMIERHISEPSAADQIVRQFPHDLVMLVTYDSLAYARQYKTKAVKKTLSIPEWLNDLALKEGISFSQVLQEALMEKLLNK